MRLVRVDALIADDVIVLRLVWNPFHFDEDGTLLSTAFDGPDLLATPDEAGVPRYMSVDDRAQISQMAVDWVVAEQQKDGKLERLKRHIPRFVEFSAGKLRGCPGVDGQQMVELSREPVAEGELGPGSPSNVGHCGVKTLRAEQFLGLKKSKQKSVLNHMRTQLMKTLDAVHDYGSVFGFERSAAERGMGAN